MLFLLQTPLPGHYVLHALAKIISPHGHWPCSIFSLTLSLTSTGLPWRPTSSSSSSATTSMSCPLALQNELLAALLDEQTISYPMNHLQHTWEGSPPLGHQFSQLHRHASAAIATTNHSPVFPATPGSPPASPPPARQVSPVAFAPNPPPRPLHFTCIGQNNQPSWSLGWTGNYAGLGWVKQKKKQEFGSVRPVAAQPIGLSVGQPSRSNSCPSHATYSLATPLTPFAFKVL